MARRRKLKVETPKAPDIGDKSVDVLNDEGETVDIKFFPDGKGLKEFLETLKGKKYKVWRYVGWVLDKEGGE